MARVRTARVGHNGQTQASRATPGTPEADSGSPTSNDGQCLARALMRPCHSSEHPIPSLAAKGKADLVAAARDPADTPPRGYPPQRSSAFDSASVSPVSSVRNIKFPGGAAFRHEPKTQGIPHRAHRAHGECIPERAARRSGGYWVMTSVPSSFLVSLTSRRRA